MEEPSPAPPEPTAGDRPSGKKRSRTRWGPDKDGPAGAAQPSGQQPPTDGGPPAAPPQEGALASPGGSTAEDAARRRKRTRWGPGEGGTAEQGPEVDERRHCQMAEGGRIIIHSWCPSSGRMGTNQGSQRMQEAGAESDAQPSGEHSRLSAEDLCTLYVGNISASVTEEGLTSLFSSVVPSSLESCTLAVDPAPPYHHRGYAIVRVRDEAGAQRCQTLLNDYPLGGQNLVVRPKGSMALPGTAEMPAASQHQQQQQGTAAAAAAWGQQTSSYPPHHSSQLGSAAPAAGAAAAPGYDYYSAGYPGAGAGYDAYTAAYYAGAAGPYPGGYGGSAAYGSSGGASGANATPMMAVAAPGTPVAPGERPPGTEHDPAYEYAYPAPNIAVVVPPGPGEEVASAGEGAKEAAAAALQGMAQLAAAVKAAVERREEEELLPPGVEAREEFAAGQANPPHLFPLAGALQQQGDAAAAQDQWGAYGGYDAAAAYAAAGYDAYGGYYDAATGVYYDYSQQQGYGGAGEAAQQGGQQAAKPNLEPPRIKPRVPRSRQRKAAAAAAGEAIAVPLPADWEEKQKAKKMEEAAAKMAAAAAAKADGAGKDTGAVGKGLPGALGQQQQPRAGVAAGAAKLPPRPRSPLPMRGSPPRFGARGRSRSPSRSPLRYSRSPSPRRPFSSRSPSLLRGVRGRSFSRSPPPHRRYPTSRSPSPYGPSPRYAHSRSPSPSARGGFRGRRSPPLPSMAAGRGRGRGFARGRGGYGPPRVRSPGSPLDRTRRYDSRSPPPHRYSPSPPGRGRSRSPSYGAYPPARRPGAYAPGSGSPSPSPRGRYSRSPLGARQRYELPPQRASPPRSPASSAEEGELEEGELDVDPREARKLLRAQERRPSPPPPRRGPYGHDERGGFREGYGGGGGPGPGGRGRPPPPPDGGRGRGGVRGLPPHDYAGEFDFVSGQPVPMPMPLQAAAVPVMGPAGLVMGMLPLGMAGMMGRGMVMGMPPGGFPGRGGFGRGGRGGRF
ncbi:hypothetical protein N2152v2_007433 [Parachlorella kessleri]